MNIFLHISPLSKYSRNTDLRYLKKFVDGNNYFPDIEFYNNPDLVSGAGDLINLLGNRVLGKLGISSDQHTALYHISNLSYLPERSLRNTHSGAILTHGTFPVNIKKHKYPIMWETGMLGLEYLSQYHRDEEIVKRALQVEINVKRIIGSNASLISIAYPGASERFKQYLPELAERVRTIPPFLPHIRATDWANIIRKYTQPDKIYFTFIGNQARRKGLPNIYAALAELPEVLKQKLEINIVSALSDGEVHPPSSLRITHTQDLTANEINYLLSKTHIFCMPSKVESYGFVYVEAMAQGCIVIAPDSEPQRYLLNDGKCGFLISPGCKESLIDVLKLTIDQPSSCLDKVENAWSRVHTHLGPKASALKYMDAFEELNLRT